MPGKQCSVCGEWMPNALPHALHVGCSGKRLPKMPPTAPKFAGSGPTYMEKRNQNWGLVSPIRAPFASVAASKANAGDPTKFEYWFDYFWNEAVEAPSLSAGDQVRLTDAFLSVLTGLPGPLAVNPALAAMGNHEKWKVLHMLLTIGFQRVPLDAPVTAPPPTSGRVRRPVVKISEVVDGRVLFTESIKYDNGGAKEMKIGYRGDSRGYDDLVKQTGFLARARSEGQEVFAKFGFDQQWHPFSQQVYRNSLFLRKGHNKDNCLHTVVSVGRTFEELIQYPLLTDESRFPLGAKPLSQWDANDEQIALNKYWVRTVKDSAKIDHIENDIRIFVLSVDGTRGFSTEAWQRKMGVTNPFPEMAMQEIPIDNILAELSITRKYFYYKSSLLFYDYEVTGQRILPTEEVQTRVRGAGFVAALKEQIRRDLSKVTTNFALAKRQYQEHKTGATETIAVGAGKCSKCGKTFPSTTKLRIHETGCKG